MSECEFCNRGWPLNEAGEHYQPQGLGRYPTKPCVTHMRKHIEELESAGRALLEWDKKYPKGTTYSCHKHAKLEDELTAIIERFRALLEPKS